MRQRLILLQRRRVLHWLLGGAGGLTMFGWGGGGGDNIADVLGESGSAVGALPADVTLDDIRYRMVRLLFTPEDSGVANAVNSRGEVVGYIDTPALGRRRAFVYSNGVMRDLDAGVATDINDSGSVLLGGSVLSSDGVLQEIPTLGGQFHSGLAINASGAITGVSETAQGSTRAFLYTGGRIQDLGTLGGRDSRGHDINDKGQITGTAALEPGTSAGHMFLWDCDIMHDLGTLGGASSAGEAINEKGWIAGYSSVPGDDRWHAVLYRDGRMTDLGFLTEEPGLGDRRAFGINERGWVVGEQTVREEGMQRGWVHDGRSMRDLSSLVVDDMGNPIPVGTGPVVTSATDINDAGQIVGYAMLPEDQPLGPLPQPILLNPVLRP